MLVQGKRPRELRWYHAGPMLFGDWGTSRLYVLGLCFFYTGNSSFWFMLAMSGLLLAVGWAYQVICRHYPDGGGVYSSARHRSALLGMIGGLLLCSDYVVTAAISALDAFHYLNLPAPQLWALGGILLIGAVNYFGPRKTGSGAMVIALATVVFTLTIAAAAAPHLGAARLETPQGSLASWWTQFTFIILAISGVEAVANMTGIMVEPVEQTARRSILPVMIEIVVLNLVLTLAMQALPLETLGGGNPEAAGHAHRDDMLRLLAEYYVGPVFAAGASLIFAFLLLSAVNTAVTDLVSIQFMMARDRELPRLFGGLNRWGMPAVPLLVAAVIPALVVFVVPDVADLADLYAVGVIGAITVNLATTSTNFALSMKRWERGGMLALALALTAMWLTIVYQKPWAFLFTMSIVGVGLTCRWLVQHRDDIRDYLLTPVPTFLAPTPPDLRQPMMAAPEAIEEPPAESAAAAPAPGLRIMVAARGDPALLRFATEEARSRRAALLVLFVRHLPITTMGSTNNPDARDDLEAQFVFQAVEPMARRAQVPVTYLYAVAEDVADAILDLAATHGANFLILGASRRSTLWRTMKGDILQRVALHLPERTTLLIHA